MPNNKHPSLRPVKVIAHDQGPSFALTHHFPDVQHSTVKNGGSKHGTLEKIPPKPKEEKDKLNYFV